MLALINKELGSFLSSIVGYLVIVIFLALVSLFVWVFPGEFNILDGGFSTMEPMFTIAPWVFMFLIPAITMRFFAEEKKTGTIELLLTKPISELRLVLSKYFAGHILVIFALIPTLIYYITIYQIGNPVGNIDTGGVMGSYFGLLFLSSAFISIGIFSSSITDNQIVSFIISVFLSFFFFTGIEAISSIPFLESVESFLLGLSINSHYQSMSRGVLDTRDIIYFLSFTGLFVILTRLVLESRKW